MPFPLPPPRSVGELDTCFIVTDSRDRSSHDIYGTRSTASRTTFTGDSSRRQGQRPSISSTNVQLRKVRTRTSPARRPRLVKVSWIAMVFHYVGSDQDFEAKQQRSTDPYFILIVMPLYLSSTCKKKSRPADTSAYNEDAENLDADTH